MTSPSEISERASLQEAIVPRLGKLSPALRRAADYVLNNPDSVAMESLRQIAKTNQLTPATFSRLARSLDLESYEVLRDLCRDEVRVRSRSFADKASALQSGTIEGKGSFLRTHAAASVENIDNMVASLDGEHLARIADMLGGARTVTLVGALSSAALVDYLGYSAEMALPNWQVALRNHSSAAMELIDMRRDDVLLVLSHEPYAKSAINAAKFAHSRGASVVAITDTYSAPVTDWADEIIITPTESPHFFVSEVATLLLLEVLLSMVVQRIGKKAQRRIAAVEKENHHSGEYWQG